MKSNPTTITLAILLTLLMLPIALSQNLTNETKEINATWLNETLQSLQSDLSNLQSKLNQLNSTFILMSANQSLNQTIIDKTYLNEHLIEELSQNITQLKADTNNYQSNITTKFNELISSHNSLIIKENSTSAQLSEINKTITQQLNQLNQMNKTISEIESNPSTTLYLWIALAAVGIAAGASLALALNKG